MAEWNGTTAQMARMAQDGYNIIKSVDPDALVTTPTPVNNGAGPKSISGWMSDYLAANGGNYADIVSFHGYINPARGQAPESIISTLDQITSAISGTPLSSLPLWDTEGAWGKPANLPDPDLQAAFVARVYLLQWSNEVQRFYWFQYGSTQPAGLWAPSGLDSAGLAYEQSYDWIVGANLASPCSAAGSVWTCNFTKPGGIQEQAVWDASQTCSGGNCTTTSYTPDPVYTEYTDLAGVTTPFIPGTEVQIGAKPLLLRNH
jgi:hypothetical protein